MNRRAFLLNIGQALVLVRSNALAMRAPGDDEFIMRLTAPYNLSDFDTIS